VYIFESSKANDDPQFLGGAGVSVQDGTAKETFFAETELSDLRNSNTKHIYEEVLTVASSEWTIVVVPLANTFEEDLTFVILDAIMIFVACTCLAMLVYARRVAMINTNQITSRAEAEKAALLVETAKASARSMLYRRGKDFGVLLECPENLMISTDRLRLTQIILNFGRNATFCYQGFCPAARRSHRGKRSVVRRGLGSRNTREHAQDSLLQVPGESRLAEPRDGD
jgi:C4-dicarboxylate-specific signal transduction histidine kinase